MNIMNIKDAKTSLEYCNHYFSLPKGQKKLIDFLMTYIFENFKYQTLNEKYNYFIFIKISLYIYIYKA